MDHGSAKNVEEKELRRTSPLTDNWSELLLLMEFAFNNIPSTNTGIFLFFTNKEYYLNITVYSEYNIAFFYTWNFAVNLNEL